MKLYRDLIQGSDEWYLMRMGKITGTRLKSVKMKKDDPVLIYEIISEMFNPVIEDKFVTEGMQRGKDYEPISRQLYGEYVGHRIEEIGFVQHQKLDYSGYSPDGMIRINGVYTKSLEIKCPATKTHCQYIKENKIPDKYESQILSAFFNADTVNEVVFISYDDRCQPKPMFIKEVKREQYEADLKELEEKVPAFWEKVIRYYNEIIF